MSATTTQTSEFYQMLDMLMDNLWRADANTAAAEKAVLVEFVENTLHLTHLTTKRDCLVEHAKKMESTLTKISAAVTTPKNEPDLERNFKAYLMEVAGERVVLQFITERRTWKWFKERADVDIGHLEERLDIEDLESDRTNWLPMSYTELVSHLKRLWASHPSWDDEDADDDDEDERPLKKAKKARKVALPDDGEDEDEETPSQYVERCLRAWIYEGVDNSRAVHFITGRSTVKQAIGKIHPDYVDRLGEALDLDLQMEPNWRPLTYQQLLDRLTLMYANAHSKSAASVTAPSAKKAYKPKTTKTLKKVGK